MIPLLSSSLTLGGIPKSPDGRYHRCINVASIQGYGYKRVTRCFIVPPPGV